MKKSLSNISAIAIVAIVLSVTAVAAYTPFPTTGTTPTTNNVSGPIMSGASPSYRTAGLSFGKATVPTAGTVVDVNGTLSVSGGRLFVWANASVADRLEAGALAIDALKGPQPQGLCAGQALEGCELPVLPAQQAAPVVFTKANCPTTCTFTPETTGYYRVEAWGGGGAGHGIGAPDATSATDSRHGGNSFFCLSSSSCILDGGNVLLAAKGGLYGNSAQMADILNNHSYKNSKGDIIRPGFSAKTGASLSQGYAFNGTSGGNSFRFDGQVVGQGGLGGGLLPHAPWYESKGKDGSGYGAGGGGMNNAVPNPSTPFPQCGPCTMGGEGGHYVSSVVKLNAGHAYTIIVGAGGQAPNTPIKAGNGAPGAVYVWSNPSQYYGQ